MSGGANGGFWGLRRGSRAQRKGLVMPAYPGGSMLFFSVPLFKMVTIAVSHFTGTLLSSDSLDPSWVRLVLGVALCETTELWGGALV